MGALLEFLLYWFVYEKPRADLCNKSGGIHHKNRLTGATGYKVIVIDDDAHDVGILCASIGQVDPKTQCTGFSSAEEAINALTSDYGERIPTHIFINDNLPGMSGLDCVAKLRAEQRFNSTIIISISKNMDVSCRERFVRAGADTALSKRFSMSDYVDILRRVLVPGRVFV